MVTQVRDRGLQKAQQTAILGLQLLPQVATI